MSVTVKHEGGTLVRIFGLHLFLLDILFVGNRKIKGGNQS